MNDGLIAAIQQHVGNSRFDLRPFRNRKQVVLAPGLRNLDQFGGCQAAGVRQDRPGNSDFGMAGQIQRRSIGAFATGARRSLISASVLVSILWIS